MSIIKQINAPSRVSHHFKDVQISSKQFATLIESLQLRGLLVSPTQVASSHGYTQWIGESDNVMITTSIHPYLNKTHKPVTVGVTGTPDQIREVHTVLGLLSITEDASTPKFNASTDIQYHTTPNPKLWNIDAEPFQLLPHVRDALDLAAREFITFMKFPDVIVITDVTITGSSANYNWTESSDIDLHILVDLTEVLPEYDELVAEYLQAKKTVWNDTHDIKIYDIPVEFYVQDIHEVHHSTGVYSLLDDEWVEFPTHNPPKIDDTAVNSKVKDLQKQIDIACKSNKADYIEKLAAKITKMRKTALEKGGEFAVGNLAFKELRKSGYIDKLHDCRLHVFDRELSVEDEEWQSMF